jgi:hypothetical protein
VIDATIACAHLQLALEAVGTKSVSPAAVISSDSPGLQPWLVERMEHQLFHQLRMNRGNAANRAQPRTG